MIWADDAEILVRRILPSTHMYDRGLIIRQIDQNKQISDIRVCRRKIFLPYLDSEELVTFSELYDLAVRFETSPFSLNVNTMSSTNCLLFPLNEKAMGTLRQYTSSPRA